MAGSGVIRRLLATIPRVTASPNPLYKLPQETASLENLVGTAGQRQRNADAERAGGLQVDVHLDFGSLLHWQIGRLVAFKDSPGIDSDEAMTLRNVGPVAHQTTGRSELAPLVDCGHGVLKRKRGKLLGMAGEERITRNYQPGSPQLGQLCEDSVEVLFSTCVQDMQDDSKRTRRRKRFMRLRFGKLRNTWIDQQGQYARLGKQLVQQLHPLRCDLCGRLGTPVTLPPSRLRLATSPFLTGLLAISKTIGMVLVAAFAASAVGVLLVASTATFR
jgi:hypothetical protein